MVVGALRGKDSTGMFQVSDKGEVNHFKLPYEGWIFAMHPAAMKMSAYADDSFATIVHHRAATFGQVSHANAHPFTHRVGDRSVIGVHNGSLSSIAYRYDDLSFSVDSDLLYYKIAKMGGKAAIEDSKGAMTLVWYENDGKMRIYSNGLRPLAWNYVPKEEVMLLASEDSMLHHLCDRNDIPLEKTMWIPQKDTLYIIDPNNVRQWESEKIDDSKTTYSVAARQNWGADNTTQRPLSLAPPRNGKNNSESATATGGIIEQELEPRRHQETYQGEPLYKGYDELKQMFGLVSSNEVIFAPLLPSAQPPSKWQQLIGQAIWRDTDGQDHKCLSLMTNVDESTREIIYEAAEAKGEIRARPINTCLIRSNKAGAMSVRILVLMRPHDTRYVPLDDVLGQSTDDSPELIVPGPKGHMSIAAFKQQTKDGCTLCCGEIPVAEAIAGEASWEPNSGGGVDWLCADCTARTNLDLAFPGYKGYVCQE